MQLLRLKLRTIQANNIKTIQTKQHNQNAYQKKRSQLFLKFNTKKGTIQTNNIITIQTYKNLQQLATTCYNLRQLILTGSDLLQLATTCYNL